MLKELDVLKAAMESVGFKLVRSESGSMDSGSAEFSNGTKLLKIEKDRSQWLFTGSKKELEPVGLWKAFDDTYEFRDAILEYIKKLDT
jgi:hypothetical protein